MKYPVKTKSTIANESDESRYAVGHLISFSSSWQQGAELETPFELADWPPSTANCKLSIC